MTWADVDVRATTREDGKSLITDAVTARKPPGSRCSAAERTGCQAASAYAMTAVVVWDIGATDTLAIVASTPGSGAGVIALTASGKTLAGGASLNGACVSRAVQTVRGVARTAKIRVARAHPGDGSPGAARPGGSVDRRSGAAPAGSRSSLTSRLASASALASGSPATGPVIARAVPTDGPATEEPASAFPHPASSNSTATAATRLRSSACRVISAPPPGRLPPCAACHRPTAKTAACRSR